MAAKAGGHHGTVFHSHCGVTQGDTLSPMIFNVSVDAVIRHWVSVVRVTQEGARQEGLGTPIHTLLAILYADDRLIALP